MCTLIQGGPHLAEHLVTSLGQDLRGDHDDLPAVVVPQSVATSRVQTLLPWIGVIALGYAMGPWYAMPAPRARQRRLLAAGVALLPALVPAQAGAKTTISWWHAMTGANAEVVAKIAGDFNASQSDYVVKPVEDARLSKALDKIEAALGARRVIHAPRQPLRLTVDRGGKKVFIPAADVCYFEARADFCNAICAEGTYLINESISSLERRLSSEGFIRVHRSYLVNLEDVHNVEIGSTGLMELRLDRVSSTVPVSRRRAAEVKSHLGLA